MNTSNIQFLESKEGKKILAEMSKLEWNKRHKYLFSADEDMRQHISSISALLESRDKAKGKFSKNKEMFFSLLGLEQSSSEDIANHISLRFKKEWQVADLSCGIGSNSIAIAKKCKSVYAIEKNEATFLCAKCNAKVYNVDKKIKFINTKAEDFIVSSEFKNIDAVFIDPARDRDDKTKTRSIINSEPKILDILPMIFKQSKNVAIKISPAFDWQEIDLLPEEPEIEVISVKNNCKMAILWFGDLKRKQRTATCFRADNKYIYSSNNFEEKASLDSSPSNYLFEPEKALLRAKVAESFAIDNNLKKIDKMARYLSSDKIITGPGRNLKIIISEKNSLRKFNKELKKLKVERAEIIAKNYFLKPEEIRLKLKLKEGGDFVVYVVKINDKDNLFILGEKV